MCFRGGGGGQRSMVKDHIFTFFLDPSLRQMLEVWRRRRQRIVGKNAQIALHMQIKALD